ncbi:hypothetical protein [Hydromonas duriensis]|uniref:Uncharacterized protein n=1 Tax=Hydromonas duriensis TaxID=1527608 RepID=A0A4R6Y522_9BURK|nr:hypothetical protein [Hydromonas duriensis]TDR30334.1 hypothetical protein DFR44_1223 [Hydromonas duriensis]
MSDDGLDFECYQEQYSVYTPTGVVYVRFDDQGRHVSGHESAMTYLDTMLRLGVVGDDGRMVDQTQYRGDDLMRYVNGQYGLLVVVSELL